MKCISCDKLMTDFETTRKIITNENKTEYPDLCNRCFKESGLRDLIPVMERTDLATEVDITEEVEYYYYLEGIDE